MASRRLSTVGMEVGVTAEVVSRPPPFQPYMHTASVPARARLPGSSMSVTRSIDPGAAVCGVSQRAGRCSVAAVAAARAHKSIYAGSNGTPHRARIRAGTPATACSPIAAAAVTQAAKPPALAPVMEVADNGATKQHGRPKTGATRATEEKLTRWQRAYAFAARVALKECCPNPRQR